MQTFSVEVVQVELSPIAWKQCTVIRNLETSLFQLLSNILAYKNPHVYMFFCKVLSVAFNNFVSEYGATRNSNCSWKNVIWCIVSIVSTPTPSPPPLSRTSWKFFISHSVSRHANWLLCPFLARLDPCATRKCVK